MLVPEPTAPTEIEHITPSVYEASRDCLAKAAWYACGQRNLLPENSAAILGNAFHAAVAAAHRGELVINSETGRSAARQVFDETARVQYEQAHPLIRLKFPAISRLPFYNLQRERAALLATRIASTRPPSTGVSAASSYSTRRLPRTESRLCSSDGLIIGRADHLDRESESVIDYKSGHASEAECDVVSESEARQLRLYAYLGGENGIPVSKGVVIRGDGRRCELPITSSERLAEGDKARQQLQKLNAAIRREAEFAGLASPSARTCRSCPCIPFCVRFWIEAKPEWQPECGSQAEGCVLEAQTRQVQGISLTTLLLEVRGGTVPGQSASVEQVPNEWLTIGGGELPRTGDRIRVVHGRLCGINESAAVIRVDKPLTAIWRLPSDRNSNTM